MKDKKEKGEKDNKIGSAFEVLTDFKLFLLKNPVLVNGGLFLHYYSKHRMLMDAESRTTVLLPDKKPLPSLLVDVEANRNEGIYYCSNSFRGFFNVYAICIFISW